MGGTGSERGSIQPKGVLRPLLMGIRRSLFYIKMQSEWLFLHLEEDCDAMKRPHRREKGYLLRNHERHQDGSVLLSRFSAKGHTG